MYVLLDNGLYVHPNIARILKERDMNKEYFYGFDCFWDAEDNTIKMVASRKTNVSHKDKVTITTTGAHVFVEGLNELAMRKWAIFIIGQSYARRSNSVRWCKPFRYEDCHTRMSEILGPSPEWLSNFVLEEE